MHVCVILCYKSSLNTDSLMDPVHHPLQGSTIGKSQSEKKFPYLSSFFFFFLFVLPSRGPELGSLSRGVCAHVHVSVFVRNCCTHTIPCGFMFQLPRCCHFSSRYSRSVPANLLRATKTFALLTDGPTNENITDQNILVYVHL